jgi:Cu-processing system permease protein
VRAIYSIAKYTIIQNFRNKTFYVLVLFSAILFASSFLFSSLGGEQEKRLLFDLGTGCIEIFGLIIAVFASVTLILEEIETRTLYLIITRPIQRYQYVIGRYVGIITAVGLGIVLMGILHLILLVVKGWEFDYRYGLYLIMTIEKIAVISSLALFFSLFSTSSASSIVFTFFFWVLGHFSAELGFLSVRIKSLIVLISMKLFYYIIPNLQYFNLRDQWDTATFSISFLMYASGYACVYAGACLFLSILLFQKKEF